MIIITDIKLLKQCHFYYNELGFISPFMRSPYFSEPITFLRIWPGKETLYHLLFYQKSLSKTGSNLFLHLKISNPCKWQWLQPPFYHTDKNPGHLPGRKLEARVVRGNSGRIVRLYMYKRWILIVALKFSVAHERDFLNRERVFTNKYH